MRIIFTSELDPKLVLATEIGGQFDDLEDFINLPSLEPENLEHAAIHYRHLKEPLSWHLTSPMITPPNVTFRGPFAGYYIIEESVIDVATLLTEAANVDNIHRPVIQAEASIFLSDCANSCNIGRVTIGYSTDGGLTYTPLSNYSRPTGPTSGDTRPYFNVPQLHYWTGNPVYYPNNQQNDLPIIIIGSFGGEYQQASTAGIDKIGIMANGNTLGICQMQAQLEVTMRDQA